MTEDLVSDLVSHNVGVGYGSVALAERLRGEIRDRAIELLTDYPDGFWISSHKLAEMEFHRRLSDPKYILREGKDVAIMNSTGARIFSYKEPDVVKADKRQTIDYVQHCLREMYHSCRHARRGGFYFVHAEKECGPLCRTLKAEREAVLTKTITQKRLCPECFIQVPWEAEICDLCENNLPTRGDALDIIVPI